MNKESILDAIRESDKPITWEVVRLGDIADFINGYPFKPSQWTTKGRPIIRIQNLTESSDKINYFNGELDKKYLVQNGDLLISWSASLDAFIWNKDQAWLNQHIFKVDNISDNVDKIFLYFTLRFYIDLFRSKTRGSTMKHITKKEFNATTFPLPPLPEQKSIAHILSTVQRAKEATEQVIQATKELKKSLMKHLFTYGPVSLEEAPNVKLKETEIGMVPEEWEVIPLGRLADVKGGKRLPKGHEFAKAATRYPYIRVTDLRENGVNIKDLKYLTKGDADLLTRYIINSSDVYISIAGTIGLVGVVPEELNGANLTENCARIIINDDSTLDKNFLFRYLSSEEGQNSISIRTSKTSQPKLALIRIKQIPLAVPSLEEQKRISHYLKIIDVKISTNGDRLIALDELFKTLLNNLMTGKIRVKNFEVPKA